MMQAGAIIVVFGLLLLGRGAWDWLRSAELAANNRHDRNRPRFAWLQRRRSWQELRSPPPVHAIAVRRQARRVLMLGVMV
ncbi:MAG: hypothetical protein N2423_05390, partial [Novosphingobium sp.]|nr:hypothetical protein [Novosphingobium sp.]